MEKLVASQLTMIESLNDNGATPLIVRVSKYSSAGGDFFRVSVMTESNQVQEFMDNIKTMTEASRLFEELQRKYVGSVKSPFKTGDFL